MSLSTESALRADGTAAPLLDVADLHTHFDVIDGTVHAVNGVDFRVLPGEIVGLVGETGCGKSVTLRSVLGLVEPPGRVVRGHVNFDGQNLVGLTHRQMRPIRGRRIGFVAQQPWAALNPVYTVGKQFEHAVRAHRDVSRAEARELAVAMLRKVELPSPSAMLNRYAFELSGGMAQRVVIALAMVLEPDLVVADEPTTALDLTVQRQILDLVYELTREAGRAMLIVTHDLGVVANYCDRVVVMYAGKVAEQGPVEAVFSRPAHPYTRALLDAVPEPGEPLRSLPGTLPSLVDYPAGCPFVDRCGRVGPTCHEVMPRAEIVANAADHLVACHHPVEA